MATKKEQIAQEVAKAVGAGKVTSMDTVDFNDPNRPKTCLEVDFPILPVNAVSALEATTGATKKPVYQLSKWWARRQPSVFRSLLIAAATKAPEDKSHAAKLVWENQYSNHLKKGAFKHLKVTDIFMGGGTTLVEGARLGMQMTGTDLNPVAWFVVKQELSQVEISDVKQLLAAIEADVKPQLMPYYYCDGPDGEKGEWKHTPSDRIMPPEFDPLKLTTDQRKEYTYSGPEIIYTLFAKHGPCQVTGCGHRTPIMTSPIVAEKVLPIKYWEHNCSKCEANFHVEEVSVRMAPNVPLFLAPSEIKFSVLDTKKGVTCPCCGHTEIVKLGNPLKKKVELSLLAHPEWLAGSDKKDNLGNSLGGSAQDDAPSSARWNNERAKKMRLLEVRGTLPERVTCPDTNVTFSTKLGTVPSRSKYACGACGTVQDVLATVKASGKNGPMAAYAIQGYSSKRKASGAAYSGRFFASFGPELAEQLNAAAAEWDDRKDGDLANYWPRSEIPYGFMTSMANGDIRSGHGHTHWWTLFNSRQLLTHALLLKSICTIGEFSEDVREFVLSAFQQYLRNQCLLTIWDFGADQLTPALSNNNFHPKATTVENCVFGDLGRGNWLGCAEGLIETLQYHLNPWDNASNSWLEKSSVIPSDVLSGKTTKIYPGDRERENQKVEIFCGSSTELSQINSSTVDLVITDPPFGGLLHYSELSDFFYVWLRLALKDKYPNYFTSEYTPKSLEAVANKAREPNDADGFYQRLLTQCWREAYRLLKPGGILAFTFHHSEDEPWVAVLESLFDAGYYLEATYPIRSDETKGEGEFGSKTIEYDIIHVCRKRTEEPKPVSWGRMRREVMADVRQLQGMLENHAKEGLPAADIQVIRRGKALEYFSRHYGKVYVDEGQAISVRDALIGINQLIDEDADKGKEAPPVNLEPMSRQFLRTFDGKSDIPRDQLQKFLKGSITTPDEFVQRGWCTEKNKVFTLVDPLDFARDWQGKHKRKLTSDLDQALVLIGACIDGSGINAADTLKNDNFKPHAALKPLLDWMSRRAATSHSRNAAIRAISIYNNWAAQNQKQVQQMALFFDEA
jgi:putative DNA methylase